ncbi:NUDIX domain-containing protein [Kordiimonas lipolytica]|uniref:NUDIX domain-containing protein n=1 Tax=Kordiimonas lipolytica TaxID=1662421 RepID=A0ABV8U858_9PROT|nr:NUDIX hydrolase [Kordiimonas lipolytica]
MYWEQVKSTRKELEQDLPVSAKVVLMSKDGKALVMRKSSGLFDLPGGKVESGEDLFKALKREMKEEAGLKAKKFEFVSSWVKHHPTLGDRLVLVFTAHLPEKAKDVEITLSNEHRWGEFKGPKAIAKIGDIPPGYANALHICFLRAGKIKP